MVSTEPYYRLSATEAVKRMRSGTLTVVDYTTSLLAHIKDRDHVVKAWAYLDPVGILAQAEKLDQVSPEQRGPLHGLPVGVKDIILTKDMPTQHNSLIFKDDAPALDAAPVITLRASGALVFGKTTTTEFASVTTGGPCGNPHDPSRTPGGSSSGSAAAVADYQVPVALGTQTGGSMIRPGSFNGIWALKPTWGAISREGLKQCSISNDTLGFYARNADDLALLSEVFRLTDEEQIYSTPFSLKDARFALCKTHEWPNAGQGTKDAMNRGAELLRNAGAVIDDIELPEQFAKISVWHQNIMEAEARSTFLGDYLLAKDKLAPEICAWVEDKKTPSRKAQLEAYDGCAGLRPVFDAICTKYTAIITPSVVDEAPSGLQFTGSPIFNKMWTILHVPAVNVPGFVGEHGMPVGLTLVTPRYQDMRLLHVAKAVGVVFEAGGGFKSAL